ncbi:MAG: 23S rRNA (pseudouridine(1915)-N(3))-methyltransferase RlmH [Erysipelotrichaceae bacterium]|mgnify:FL=1|nr:23S rRNA (pseudouridine(1915)-N(3))-methyltransferase RlmH [Erysipelotrichaceae bacterium]
MIRLICVGRNKDKNLEALNREYLKRLQAFDKIQVEEVKDEPDVHSERENEAKAIKDKESSRVLSKIKDSDFVVLLDLHGKMMDSVEFSKERQKWQARGNLVFVIAGSLGPGQELVSRANARWKISDLTFTHLMCRTLVLEQIYRSFMIENNRSYHK